MIPLISMFAKHSQKVPEKLAYIEKIGVSFTIAEGTTKFRDKVRGIVRISWIDKYTSSRSLNCYRTVK